MTFPLAMHLDSTSLFKCGQATQNQAEPEEQVLTLSFFLRPKRLSDTGKEPLKPTHSSAQAHRMCWGPGDHVQRSCLPHCQGGSQAGAEGQGRRALWREAKLQMIICTHDQGSSALERKPLVSERKPDGAVVVA